MSAPLDAWFKAQILPHEGMLMRFLARAWPNPSDWADLRQEAYARVLQAARQAGQPQHPKAFLFSIARHIMADRRRRERIVSIKAAGDDDLSNDLVEERTPERIAGAHQELARLAAAFDQLPEKCRQVVWLRRVQGLAQKEVALKMMITEKAVEKQIARASRLLARLLQQPLGDADLTSGVTAANRDGKLLDEDQV